MARVVARMNPGNLVDTAGNKVYSVVVPTTTNNTGARRGKGAIMATTTSTFPTTVKALSALGRPGYGRDFARQVGAMLAGRFTAAEWTGFSPARQSAATADAIRHLLGGWFK